MSEFGFTPYLSAQHIVVLGKRGFRFRHKLTHRFLIIKTDERKNKLSGLRTSCPVSDRYRAVIKKLLFVFILFIFASKRTGTSLNDDICKLFYLLPN
ncbi:hypothetical protein TFKS16_2988 [Tannerella forsythia KS16]|nr:hypothetical protein TFKS16_2988 [Tannerella forsythia KS16]